MKGILKIVIYYVNYVIFRHPTGLTNKRRHLISDIKNTKKLKNSNGRICPIQNSTEIEPQKTANAYTVLHFQIDFVSCT